MANSFMLLRIAFNTAKFRRQSREKNRKRGDRESLARSAHDGVRELTGWRISDDGSHWRHHWGNRDGMRHLATPCRTDAGLCDDLFYATPGAWTGNVQELLKAELPYGNITVDSADAVDAMTFLRQWCRVTCRGTSPRWEGGTRLSLKPRKNFVALLRKNPPRWRGVQRRETLYTTEAAHA